MKISLFPHREHIMLKKQFLESEEFKKNIQKTINFK